jgi:hypothetical protein
VSDWRDLSIWQELARPERAAFIALAESIDPREASQVAKLRRAVGEVQCEGQREGDGDAKFVAALASAALASAAFELVEGRRRAARKFGPEVATRLWCDVAGIEQASGMAVARWKARRMVESLGPSAAIFDICSGIGGDAMALAEAGLSVEAIDLDPRRAWMTAHNARCVTRVADAEAIDLAGVALHADPARRDESAGRRSWNLDDHQPGRAWIERALKLAHAAAIKFSPGVDRAAFGPLNRGLAWEWIAEENRLVQAVAWSGAFARADGEAGHTRATLLAEKSHIIVSHTIAGIPDDAREDRLRVAEAITHGRFISEPIAAIERAELLTEAAGANDAAQEIARGLGLVVSHAPLATPWFESFEIIDECAAREDAVLATLKRHALVARSVRVRGRAADADLFTRALSARPDGQAVVFLFREGKRARGLIARALVARAR